MRRSISVTSAACLFLVLSFPLQAQNHKPVIIDYAPKTLSVHVPNVAYKFMLRASDPDGDSVTYSWRLFGHIVQSGPDSNFTMIYTDALNPPHSLTCIFSDPGGLKDSLTWFFDFLGVPPDPGTTPITFALQQNYPNPFNPSTTISYQLPRPSNVTLKVFNSLGQLVAILVDSHQQAGFYSIQWKTDATSGVYFCRLVAGEYVETRTMLLIK